MPLLHRFVLTSRGGRRRLNLNFFISLLCFQLSERANGQTIEPSRSLNLFSSKQSLQHTRHTAMNGPLILSVSNGCASVGRSPWPRRDVWHSSHLSSDRAAVLTASCAPHNLQVAHLMSRDTSSPCDRNIFLNLTHQWLVSGALVWACVSGQRTHWTPQ